MNLGDLGADLIRAAAFLPHEASQLVRSMALVALDNLVLSTPVDTGRARGNWFVSINSPSEEITEDTNYASNLVQQETIIENASLIKSIWISNNLPYIARLNDGYSGQAPSGFVEKAVVAAEKAVDISKSKFMRKL